MSQANVQETEEQRKEREKKKKQEKTRLIKEEINFKLISFVAAAGQTEDGRDALVYVKEFPEYRKAHATEENDGIHRFVCQIANDAVGEFQQYFQAFMHSNSDDFETEEEVVDAFFEWCQAGLSEGKNAQNDGETALRKGIQDRLIKKASLFLTPDNPENDYDATNEWHVKLVNTYIELLKKFWKENVVSSKSFVLNREQLFNTSCMMFSTIPHHFLNEPGRGIGLFQNGKTIQINEVFGADADLQRRYVTKANEMLQNEKPYYTKVAIENHKGSTANTEGYNHNLAIALYGFDEYDRLNKESNGQFGLKEIMRHDFAKEHNLNVIDKYKVNKAMRGTFLSKYYEDRMIACMFDQTLLGKEIDYDTLKFWRVVFENTHQKYAESLILLMNHAADETVRNLFSNNEFRKYVIERQNEIANKIEQLKREIEDLNLAISRNESMAIDPSSTQTPEDKRLNLMLKHENSRLENNISQKKAEIEQLESSLTTFFENLIMTCEMQIEEVKKYYHDEKFESENLFTDFISRQSDPSKKNEFESQTLESKYKKQIACKFDQSLQDQKIDDETLKFWWTVHSHISRENEKVLIDLLNVKDIVPNYAKRKFEESQVRKKIIEHPEILEPLIVLVTMETKVEKRVRCLPEIYDKVSSLGDLDKDFWPFICSKPESFEYLYDLKQNYPNIFCDEEYTWEQKFIVAKALLPMGLDVNNFNARTLERFLGICKTPEEFRVAYLLWENTNFINQFWLMPKITQKDLAAIVEYVGADINNKDKLLERIKEFYNELPAFGEAGYFEKNYSKAKLKESVNELVEKIGKNWSPFAKMHLISNLSGLDRDNLEYIRMLFRCNLGKEKKVLDYVGTVLEMSNGATDRNKCVKELFEDKLLREKILSKVEVCSLDQFKEIHEFSGKLDKNVRNEVAANVSYAQIDKVNELKDKKNLWFALVNKPEYINEYFSLAAAVVKNIKDENNRKSFLDSLKNFTETEKQIVLVDPDSFVNDVCFLYERHDKSEYQEEESEKETTEVSQGKGKSVLQKCDICYILADIRDGKYVSDDDLKFITNRKNVELTVALVKAGKIYLEDLPAEDKFNKLKEILKEAGISEKAPEDEKTQNAITNALLLEVRQ